MQKQKTIAKWLAVILLLTLAVASYVALSAIMNDRDAGQNIAGAQDGNDPNPETPTDDDQTPDLPPEDIQPPHIPVYSQFPREAREIAGSKVLNIGGEGDDVLLDVISCYGKDMAIFSSTSEEYDVKQSGLHIATLDAGALTSTTFLAADEEYLGCTLSASGLLVLTRDADHTYLRLIGRDMSVSIKREMSRYDSYRLFTNSGILKLYVADDDGVTAYSVSRTLTLSKSNRTASIGGARVVCILPNGTSDLIFLQTESGISIYTYSTNEGFISQNELLNCVFRQIMPIMSDGRQTLALLASNDVGQVLFGLEMNGKQFARTPLDDVPTAAMIKSGSNLLVVSPYKLYTFCSHLELTLSSDVATDIAIGDDFDLRATESGRLYSLSADGLALLSFDNSQLRADAVFGGATSAMIFRGTMGNCVAYSAADSDFEDMTFGKADVYFVIDIDSQI